jgi:molybdopterin molybdotransferase
MLDADAALAQVRAVQPPPGGGKRETVALAEALGRVLASPVVAAVDSPPFDKAAMDGYAVLAAEAGESLAVVETIAAGQVPRLTVRAGQASKIMTGAMLPEGARKVVRVEYTEEREGRVLIRQPEPYDNVIRRAENLRAGQPLLSPRVLEPQDIGVLASQGIGAVEVAVPPLVGILTTGSELASAGEALRPGQIYNSNGPQLCAQVAAMRGRQRYYGLVPDDPQALGERLDEPLRECEVVLLSGGVSMGDLDFVPGVLESKGARILFHKLALKPGKPTLFAVAEGARPGGTYVFGLPGNPVSTFIVFEVFVKALLYRLMGIDHRPRQVRLPLGQPLRRRDTERLEYRPVHLEAGRVLPTEYHGSSHLNALAGAEGLIRIERGVAQLEEGTLVDVRLL